MSGMVIVVGRIAVFCLIALLLVVAYLLIRRTILGTRGSLFDCLVRMDGATRWRIGLARYQGDSLIWYPLWSMSVGRGLVLARSHAHVTGTRKLDGGGVGTLMDGFIVSVSSLSPKTNTVRAIELGLDAGSTTGLLSWMEAAPPGGDLSAAREGNA